MNERPPISRPAPWLFAATYVLHLLDEATIAGGLPQWSTQHGFHFTMTNWVVANAISIALVLTAVHLVTRGSWPSWVLVSISSHLALHALTHIGVSLWWGSLSPGAITGLLLATPLAIWCFRWGAGVLEPRTLFRAVLIGAATFQAPWDMLVRLLFGIPFWTA